MSEKRTIEVQTLTGLRTVEAAVFGALALHRTVLGATESEFQWSITHLPSGMKFPFDFEDEDDGHRFIGAILPLINWAGAEMADIQKLKDKIYSAAFVNHAVFSANPKAKKLERESFRRDLNTESSLRETAQSAVQPTEPS